MHEPNEPVKLSDGRYRLPRFAILDEHEFADEKGRKQKFDRARLQRLAAKLNRRVQETGDMIPVVDGHTIDGLPNKHQPEVVGSAYDFKVEPFYNTGRTAIWATPIAPTPDSVKEFKRKFRRSVELYVDPHGEDDDIDPISLLGSVSPKRDLGQPHRDLVLKFSRSSGSESESIERAKKELTAGLSGHVEAYHAARKRGAIKEAKSIKQSIDKIISDKGLHAETVYGQDPDEEALRSSGNLKVKYLASLDGRIRYQKITEEPDMDTPGEDTGSKLSPGDVKAIVAELLQTEPLKKLLAMAEQMEGEEEGGEPGAEAGAGEEPFEPEAGGGEPGGETEAPPPEPDREGMPKREMAAGTPGMSSYAAPGARKFSRVPAYTGDWREWLAAYEEMNAEEEPMPTRMQRQVAAPPEEIGRMNAELVKYRRENAAQAKRIEALERENIASKINETLTELAADFEFDQEEEFKELIKMSRQEDREKHYDRIRTRYAKRQDQVPGGGDYIISAEQETALRYSRGKGRGEVEGANRYARSGEEASRIASEMARRGLTDPAVLFEQLAKEEAAASAKNNGKPIRTR